MKQKYAAVSLMLFTVGKKIRSKNLKWKIYKFKGHKNSKKKFNKSNEQILKKIYIFLNGIKF